MSICMIAFIIGAATGIAQWSFYRQFPDPMQTVSEHLNDVRSYVWFAITILIVSMTGLLVATKRLDLIGEAGACFWVGWLVTVAVCIKLYLRSVPDRDSTEP